MRYIEYVTIGITKSAHEGLVLITCNRKEFVDKYGRYIKVPETKLFEMMGELSDWVENVLGEGCNFTIF